MARSEHGKSFFLRGENEDPGNGKKGEIRKLRKESIKAKRQEEPVDFDVPESLDMAEKPPKKKTENKLKEKLEAEARELDKAIDEVDAENLIKGALGETVFEREERKEISNLPAKRDKSESLVKAADEPEVSAKTKKERPVKLGKSSQDKEESIPLGKSSLEKNNKNRKEEFYKKYGLEGKNIYGKKLYSKNSQEEWIMLNGFDESTGKPIVSFSGKEGKIDLEYFQYLLGRYTLKKEEKEKKTSARKKKEIPYPTQKKLDEHEASLKTFYEGGKEYYKDGIVPEDEFKRVNREEEKEARKPKEPEKKAEVEKNKIDQEPAKKSQEEIDASVLLDHAEETDAKKEKEDKDVEGVIGAKEISEEEKQELFDAAEGKVQEGNFENEDAGKEKSPEEEEKEAKERGESIKQLKQEVEKRRKEYLESDYHRKKAYKRLGNFFGKMFKDKEERNLENDQEIAWYRAYYDESLMQYKNAILEDAKLRNVSDKELLDIAKIFQVEANSNVADVNFQVKIENQEGKFSGFIKEHSLELVERYKKLSLAKKIAIGASFGGLALGAGYAGAAAVGVVGSAVAVRRAFLALVTGTTVSLAFEAKGNKKTEENIQKEISDLESKMMAMSEEEKIKLITEFIDKDIKDEDYKINKIKNKNLRHLAYGVAAGAATLLLPKITRAFSEKTGAGEWVKEHIFGKTIPHKTPDTTGRTPGAVIPPENPSAPGSMDHAPGGSILPENPSAPEAEVEQPMGTNVPEEDLRELRVGTGKTASLWGVLNEHFKGAGLTDEEAAKKASMMSREYIKEYGLKNGNLIHAGYDIKLDASGNKIIGITDPNFGDMSEHHPYGTGRIENPVSENPEETKIQTTPEEQQRVAEKINEMKARNAIAEKEFSDINQGPRNEIIEKIQNNADEIRVVEDQPASRYNTHDPSQHFYDLDRLKGGQRELWDKLMQEDTVSAVAGDIRKTMAISNSENWRQIKDLTFDQIKDANVSSEVKNNIVKIYRLNLTVFGKESMPKNGETMAKWTERLSRLFMKIKNK